MATVIVIGVILLFVINGVYGMVEEHRRGALCDCNGDCASCKIQCQSNKNYYGVRQVGVPKELRPAYEMSLRPENRPLVIRAIRKAREILDLICYWIFNLFALFAVGSLLYGVLWGGVIWLKNHTGGEQMTIMLTALVGLAGGLLMFVGDMLLYYTPEDFGYGPGSSTEEKLNALVDVMKGLPAKREMAGGMIGPAAAFLYCVGFYHIVLMTDEGMHPLALAAFLLSCFGIIAGGAYHSHCAYLGLLGDDRHREALKAAMTYFQKLPLLLYGGEGIGFLLLIVLIVTGNTVLPRWMFLLTPGVLFLLKPVVGRLPKGVRVIVAGGWTNLISVIYYTAVLIVLAA